MTAAAPALVAALLAQSGPELPGTALRWRVATPFDGQDVAELESWWRARAAALGAEAQMARVVLPGEEELAAGTLLLGYERGLLDELEARGALAAAPVTFAWQSWAPCWALGGDPDAPEIDSFEKLLDPALQGHVHLRSVTRESPEGLLLGELARRLDLVGERELPRLVLASYDAGTIRGATTSIDAFLRTLPAGAATIAPVRAAARARRTGLRVSWSLPREGFLALELAAAATKGTDAPLRRWFEERFASAVAPELAASLELEPTGALPGAAPEWMRLVESRRTGIDRDAAERLRVRLARLYDAAPPRGALPDPGGILDFVDTLLLTAAVVAVLLLWRRERRRGAA